MLGRARAKKQSKDKMMSEVGQLDTSPPVMKEEERLGLWGQALVPVFRMLGGADKRRRIKGIVGFNLELLRLAHDCNDELDLRIRETIKELEGLFSLTCGCWERSTEGNVKPTDSGQEMDMIWGLEEEITRRGAEEEEKLAVWAKRIKKTEEALKDSQAEAEKWKEKAEESANAVEDSCTVVQKMEE